MTKNFIVNSVKDVILKYAKPTRIYLYGSQVNGEAKSTSDIDIAYDDENSKNDYIIKEEVEKIDTLIRIDLINLAKCEERFRNRVLFSGNVIYSATKRLRTEDGLYNFTNALKKLDTAIAQKDILANEGFGDIYLDLIVKRFEFTYEMCWKALKRYLDYVGIDAKSPRMVFKEAFAQSLITDENIWLDMIEQRNLSSHIYDEHQIQEILDKIKDYSEAFNKIKSMIEKELKE